MACNSGSSQDFAAVVIDRLEPEEQDSKNCCSWQRAKQYGDVSKPARWRFEDGDKCVVVAQHFSELEPKAHRPCRVSLGVGNRETAEQDAQTWRGRCRGGILAQRILFDTRPASLDRRKWARRWRNRWEWGVKASWLDRYRHHAGPANRQASWVSPFRREWTDLVKSVRNDSCFWFLRRWLE